MICPECKQKLAPPVVTTSKVEPLGTSHWAGTYNGCPALSLGYYGGATLFYFQDKDWHKIRFESLSELHKFLKVPL